MIDTILRGWSIPPVFLVVTKDGRMDVLDGQQRLAAVRDFVHNDFTIDGENTKEQLFPMLFKIWEQKQGSVESMQKIIDEIGGLLVPMK